MQNASQPSSPATHQPIHPMLLSRVLPRGSHSLRLTAKRTCGDSIVCISGGGGGGSSSNSRSSSSRSRGRNVCQHRPLSSSPRGGDDDGNQPLREFMATLAVYFTLPEQGVTSPEILTRCSATPVKLSASSPLRFIAAGHAVVPWAFPGYFGESTAWLNFLDETHVRYYAEFREPSSGTVLAKHELSSLGQHPSRDVAALAFKDEARAISDIRSRGIPFSPLPLRRRSLAKSEALQIVGYEVRALPGSEEGEDPGMVMIRARGELAARTAKQAFVGTDHATLNPGMCGGAVLDESLELCGCVEGVVPTAPAGEEVADEQVRVLQGMPCVVEWQDLDTLLRDTMDAVGDDDKESHPQQEPLQQEPVSALSKAR